jgi:drug/metabolite transporter (DMT)-like permease
MLWSTLSAIPLFLLVALVLGERLTPASAGGWAACAGLGLMHATGQGAIAWALGRLPAPTVSVVVLVQPVVAAGLGWWLFAERVTPGAGAGRGGRSGRRGAGPDVATKTGGASEDAPPAKASA